MGLVESYIKMGDHRLLDEVRSLYYLPTEHKVVDKLIIIIIGVYSVALRSSVAHTRCLRCHNLFLKWVLCGAYGYELHESVTTE